jgi:HNH endonuclease
MDEATQQRLIALSDGERTSVEIAQEVGFSARYIRRLLARLGLPRPAEGAQPHQRNHQFVCGRRVDLDGYVLVTAPLHHPHARNRPNRRGKIMFEHRLVMEHRLGRYIAPSEVVDHIDGLTVHNAPENLRLFASNSDHLSATLRARAPRISRAGKQNIRARYRLGTSLVPVDMHSQRRALGEIRLRQILLAASELGIDSPFLLGTHRHLAKARIDVSSHSTIALALAGLDAKWEIARAQ